MKRKFEWSARRVFVLFSAFALFLMLPGSAVASEPLRCGFAAVEITPPVGYRMSGYFYERLSTGVANPLVAKAVVLEQGEERVAWLFCDLVGVPADVSSGARTTIASETGIPREKIVIAATHTHTGPLFFGALRNYFHASAVEAKGSDPAEAIDYGEFLENQLVAAVRQAAADLQPTQLAVGTAHQEDLSFNRRYVMRDGTVRMNPGKLNPDIVRPAGPIDPEVGLIQFRREDRPVAGLTVFALHLDTTGGTEYSADFPYFLQQSLRERFGDEYLSIFGIGTCGDINHVDVSNDSPQKGHGEAQRIGQALASTVGAALPTLPAVDRARLACASRTVNVPLQRYTAEEIAQARNDMAKVGTRELPMLEQVKAVSIVGIDELGVRELPMEVQAFRLSDSAALVTLPGEVFVELGLAIKQRSPFPTTLVVELANDYPGYIPTRRGFAEGSYEPTNSKITPGGGEMLVEAAAELLSTLSD